MFPFGGNTYEADYEVSVSTLPPTKPTGRPTYFPIIFFKAVPKILHGNTLTSFSIFLGFGFGNDMTSLKKSSAPDLFLDTVIGRNPSKFLRIRFFSSTENRKPTSASSK